MKSLAATGLCCILAGCSTAQFTAGQNNDFAVQVTQMSASIDSATDSVDVAVAIKNTSGVALRSVTLILTPFDVGGNRTSSPAGEVTLNGPINSGDSAGPQSYSHVWQGSDVRCVEVRLIKVTLMDYSTLIVSGHAANNLVVNNSRRQCHLQGDD